MQVALQRPTKNSPKPMVSLFTPMNSVSILVPKENIHILPFAKGSYQ